MTNELIPIDLAAALEAARADEWNHIELDMVDPAQVAALNPKYAREWRGKTLLEGYQAGVRISAGRWRWSRWIYRTANEAQAAAQKKADELKQTKGN